MGNVNENAGRPGIPGTLRRSLVLITLGGSLCMVYMTGVASPAQTEFFRHLGATKIHFGLLGGIPPMMMFMQFVGAWLAARVVRRKPIFITALILSRLVHIPVAFVPLLLPELSVQARFTLIILLTTIGAALTDVGTPMWFSWMADLIPGPIFNRYWGIRHAWTQTTWTVSYLGVALITRLMDFPILVTYPILVVGGVAAGIADILLFVRVAEPANPGRQKPMLAGLLEPLRHPEYRTFIGFSCFKNFSIMFAASFMRLYALESLEVTVAQATVLWCLYGVGGAMVARRWGRIADRHGHRPILIICTYMKPFIVTVFFLVTPGTVLWILPAAFVIDSATNAGSYVAGNGYMLQMAPAENRSMFVAVIHALTAFFAGLGSMAAGYFLEGISGVEVVALGKTLTPYHFLFLVSFFMRFVCAGFSHRIRQSKSSPPGQVLDDFMDLW